MTQAIARVPALETAGVKQMINGPESFTPDGNFILGVRPECANMFVGAGFNAFGIASGGGAGWVLAHGPRPARRRWTSGSSISAASPAMHRDREWVRDRTLEAYGKHYTIGFPHEEYESGRPRIVSPLYERLKNAWRGVRFEARLGAAELVRARRRRAPRRLFDGPAELVRPSVTSTGWCARPSASSTSPPSPNTS
jgi:hypothetical protein